MLLTPSVKPENVIFVFHIKIDFWYDKLVITDFRPFVSNSFSLARKWNFSFSYKKLILCMKNE